MDIPLIYIFLLGCLLLNKVNAIPANDKCEDSARVICTDESTFQVIVNLFGEDVNVGLNLKCPEKYFCVENSEEPCVEEIPTTTTQTTTQSETPTEITEEDTSVTPKSSPPTTTARTTTTQKLPILPPTCKTDGYHRADKCNQYYECAKYLWWYDYTLKTCNSGTYYSTKHPPCSSPADAICAE